MRETKNMNAFFHFSPGKSHLETQEPMSIIIEKTDQRVKHVVLINPSL